MRWPWRRRRRTVENGEVAKTAKREAERRLRDAQKRWPEVQQAHDRLSDLVQQALRGRQA